MQVTRSLDRVVDKAQAEQANIALFVSNMPQRKWIFEKLMKFGLLTTPKWFYIVDRSNKQFGVLVYPFLFSV